MSRLPRFATAGLLAAGLLVTGIAASSLLAADPPATERPDQKNLTPASAVAQIKGAGANKDKIKGTVTFVQAQEGVRILVDVTGLAPGKHGIHIHEAADLSDPELKGAGPHWNPEGHKHGGPAENMRHAGDLGNITADDKGNAKTELKVAGITVNGPKDAVVGHSVILHEKEDDLKTDPAGASGARIAGGVIERHAEATKKETDAAKK